MCECIIISCAVSLFLVKIMSFMAVICDIAMERSADRRYFFEIIHDWIKTDFEKEGG